MHTPKGPVLWWLQKNFHMLCLAESVMALQDRWSLLRHLKIHLAGSKRHNLPAIPKSEEKAVGKIQDKLLVNEPLVLPQRMVLGKVKESVMKMNRINHQGVILVLLPKLGKVQKKRISHLAIYHSIDLALTGVLQKLWIVRCLSRYSTKSAQIVGYLLFWFFI